MTAVTPQVSGLERYVEAAEGAFSRAATAAGGSLDRLVRVAGHGARLRFAGPAMVSAVMPALEHLEATDVHPSLTVLIWDAHSTGVTLAPPDWERVAYFERGNLRGVQDGRFTLAMDRRTHVFSAVDSRRGIAVYWARDAEWVPYLERAAPLRHVVQGWLEPEGLFVAHASAVGYPSGGVLMPGGTGSGKSTTAVLCLRVALGYLGDDFILLGATGSPAAYSLYRTAKLNAKTLAWMPEVMAEVSNPDRLDIEKALLFLRPASPGRPGTLASGFPLRAILLPHVVGGFDTKLTSVPPMTALRRILPDTLFTSLGSSAATARGLQRLVHDLPCYDLALGRDLEQVTAAIAGLLTDA
jgi:hypothetical protein